MERFREVQEHNGFKVGDVIHIKRWYYEEGTKDFNKMGNCVMVEGDVPIEKITIDDHTGKDTLWCKGCSTSSRDIANKGKVKHNVQEKKSLT
jgi:hypothetical protein